jgi:hypothetical protein
LPATSVDTFFACSLMVLIVLSAMASTSKILQPYLKNADDKNVGGRYEELSKYLLLNSGEPANWGQIGEVLPEKFGLAEMNLKEAYELDIDKVTRLNSGNIYALSQAQMFDSIGLPDTFCRIEIKPIFDVETSLKATYELADDTVYEFEISTQRHGVPVQTELTCYIVADDYFQTNSGYSSDGCIDVNMTLPNSVNGPGLLVVIARASSNSGMVSFGTHPFAHGSTEPKTPGTFLKLSPLNHSLNASILYAGINLSAVYAFSFSYSSTLPQVAINNESVAYNIPLFLDLSPTLVVATGWNDTIFFAESAAYPQIPAQIGANLAEQTNLSNTFTYTYLVSVKSAVYECTVSIGGPRD